jgi:hypothetical protein
VTRTRQRLNRIRPRLVRHHLPRRRGEGRRAEVRRGGRAARRVLPRNSEQVDLSVKAFRHSLLLLVFSALSGAAWVAHRPALRPVLQASDPERRPSSIGVLDQLAQAAIKRSAPFEISESRINEHLAATLQARPAWAGAASWWRMDAPEIDLQENLAVLRMRWRVGDVHVCDLTVNLKLERAGGEFRCEVLEGAYGRLRVPRGLLHPAKAILVQLGEALRPELDALFSMNQIRIAQDKLLLDPRFSEVEVQAFVITR